MKKRWLPWSAGIIIVVAIVMMMWNAGYLNAGIEENNFQYQNGRAAYVMMRFPKGSTGDRIAGKLSKMLKKSPSKHSTIH